MNAKQLAEIQDERCRDHFEAKLEALTHPAIDLWGEHAGEFDRDAAWKLYKRASPARASKLSHQWREDVWRRAWKKRGGLTRDGARWWLWVATDPKRLESPHENQQAADSIAARALDDPDSITARLHEFYLAWRERYGADSSFYTQDYLVLVLRCLLPIDQVVKVTLAAMPNGAASGFLHRLGGPSDDALAERRLKVFVDDFADKLDLGEDANRQVLQRLISRARSVEGAEIYLDAIKNSAGLIPACSHVQSMLALCDEAVTFDRYKNIDPSFNRLMMCMMFRHGGVSATRKVAKALAKLRDKDLYTSCVEVLTELDEPWLVELMIEIACDGADATRVLEWFERDDADILARLIAIAARTGRRADQARRVLRWLQERGQTGGLEAALEGGSESVAAQLEAARIARDDSQTPIAEDDALPDWFAELAREKTPRGWPRAIRRADVLPLVLESQSSRLPDEHVNGALELAMTCHPTTHTDEATRTLRRVLRQLDRASADRFVVDLVEKWQRAGEPPKHRWCVNLASVWGADRAVQLLADRVESWCEEGDYKHAKETLSLLGGSNDEAALMYLGRLAQKSKFKSIRAHAQSALWFAARRRGWSREQLEDRIIPTCGLDGEDEVVFDFGARQFLLEINSDGDPRLVDTKSGAVTKSLPRTRKSDDAVAAALARDDWNVLKRKLRDAVGVQRARLDEAMVQQRRWSVDDFSYVTSHPLMSHLVQGVLWALRDHRDELVQVVRVCADRTFADINDEEVHLHDAVTHIRVAHPTELSQAELDKWGAIFGEYELRQPFTQIDRLTALRDIEPGSPRMITCFSELAIEDTGWFRGHMKRRGWITGYGASSSYAGGYIAGSRVRILHKTFVSAGLRAFIELSPGYDPVTSKNDDPQQIVSVRFCRDLDRKTPGVGQLLSAIPSLVYSEVLFDLAPFVFTDSSE